MAMEIYGLPAFEDNYIWCLRQGNAIAVVDPGDAQPVLEHLTTSGRQLSAILITHHHRDHTDGIAALLERYPVPVFAPAVESITGTTNAVAGGDRITVPTVNTEFDVIDVAGHTRGHVAYYHRGVLFCGDTLFACGCGKLFEGSAEQLHAALAKLSALPRTTMVYCAHEYTASGIRFATAVEPNNTALPDRAAAVQRYLAAGQPTVPFSLADELATNPFLRCRQPEVVDSASRYVGHPLKSETEVFAALRRWRDHF
jgi:hydroxyacylglutathione hydrolase